MAIARAIVAQEGERLAIADLLHEHPVQLMTAVGLRLGTMPSPATDARAVAELQDRVDSAIAQLRRLIRALRDGAITEELPLALRRTLDDAVASRPHLQTSLDDRELAVPPSPASGLVALRVLHAAVGTVVEDGSASRITVGLAGDADIVCTVDLKTPRGPQLEARLRERLSRWTATAADLGGAVTCSEELGVVTLELVLPSDL